MSSSRLVLLVLVTRKWLISPGYLYPGLTPPTHSFEYCGQSVNIRRQSRERNDSPSCTRRHVAEIDCFYEGWIQNVRRHQWLRWQMWIIGSLIWFDLVLFVSPNYVWFNVLGLVDVAKCLIVPVGYCLCNRYSSQTTCASDLRKDCSEILVMMCLLGPYCLFPLDLLEQPRFFQLNR